MLTHRSNAGAPPVVAPPDAPDARGITTPHGVTDANVADLNVPCPDTAFKKALSPLAIAATAFLVSVVCIALLILQYQYDKPNPTPSSEVNHHLALLPAVETLPSTNNTRAQDGDQTPTQPTEPPTKTLRLDQQVPPTQVDHQHSLPALPSPNESTETSPADTEPLKATNQDAVLAISSSDPRQATVVGVANADSHKHSLGKDGNSIANASSHAPMLQDITTPNSNSHISPDQLLTENANLLISTASSDSSFTHWQPQDWMACTIAVKPEMPSKQQPNQIVCKPDSLTPPKNSGAFANSQCESPDPNYETKIGWVDQPEVAFERARGEDKLVFMIHISGNFKIPGFT